MTHLADRRHDWSPLNAPPDVAAGWDEPLDWGGRRSVCIYGGGLGRESAPLTDPDWVVWGMNAIAPYDGLGRIRADLWWDVHQRHAQSRDDLRWIARCPVPVVVPADLAGDPERPVVLPLERLLLCRWHAAPFACTFAYQIALAILDGFERIGLYGVELAWGAERERTVEWASVSWWLGHAEALGIDLALPMHSRLGTHPRLYGVEYDEEKASTEDYLRLWRRIHEPGKEITGGDPCRENDHVRRMLRGS